MLFFWLQFDVIIYFWNRFSRTSEIWPKSMLCFLHSTFVTVLISFFCRCPMQKQMGLLSGEDNLPSPPSIFVGNRKYGSASVTPSRTCLPAVTQDNSTKRKTKKDWKKQGLCSIELCLFCRPTVCRYARIGCRWKGPHQALPEHESSCVLPGKSGIEIMDALEAFDMKQAEEQKLYKSVFSLLSFEKITFNGTPKSFVHTLLLRCPLRRSHSAVCYSHMSDRHLGCEHSSCCPWRKCLFTCCAICSCT